MSALFLLVGDFHFFISPFCLFDFLSLSKKFQLCRRRVRSIVRLTYAKQSFHFEVAVEVTDDDDDDDDGCGGGGGGGGLIDDCCCCLMANKCILCNLAPSRYDSINIGGARHFSKYSLTVLVSLARRKFDRRFSSHFRSLALALFKKSREGVLTPNRVHARLAMSSASSSSLSVIPIKY